MSRYLFTIAFAAVSLSSQNGLSQIKVDFEKEIWPFIEKKCVECHKAPYEDNGRLKKPKAGLRLDGAWAYVAGSENGEVLKAGSAKDSELYVRVTLPEDDDDFMPPTGKADPLTDKEKELFAKWINEGADFGGWAGNLEGKPKEVANTGEKIPKSEVQEMYKGLAEGLAPLKEDSWKDVTASGGRVMPLATDSPLLSVDYRLTAKEATDDKVASISSIATNVAHLDLSKSGITDGALDNVSEMEKLVRLDLHQTKITDAGLAKIKDLPSLRYLNLYGTEVTDKGLNHLKSIKTLSSVYLWQSKATPAGAKKLQEALPKAKINIK